jgi:hypothetical protein
MDLKYFTACPKIYQMIYPSFIDNYKMEKLHVKLPGNHQAIEIFHISRYMTVTVDR